MNETASVPGVVACCWKPGRMAIEKRDWGSVYTCDDSVTDVLVVVCGLPDPTPVSIGWNFAEFVADAVNGVDVNGTLVGALFAPPQAVMSKRMKRTGIVPGPKYLFDWRSQFMVCAS